MIDLTKPTFCAIIIRQPRIAAVVESADTRDLKSLDHCDRTSSSLVSGTTIKKVMSSLVCPKGEKQVQKLVYLSNSRDYTEQGDINENKYFTHVNELLAQGWKVTSLTHDVLEMDAGQRVSPSETYVSFVLLEKPEPEDSE